MPEFLSAKKREQIVVMPENVDPDKHIIATYYLEVPTSDPYMLFTGIA